jgi:hypothetical protein
MSFVSRTVSMALGLVGAVIGWVVVALYSLMHVLARMSGLTGDRSHFFIGTGLAILGVIGSILVLGSPEVGAALLVITTIGLFFIVGWWAIIPALFLVSAAVIAFLSRAEAHRPPTGVPQA